jgi:hypothetical protein
MVYDKKIAELFLLNFNEAYRSGKLLLSSYDRIASLIPLKGNLLNSLSLDNLDKLDAFRVRYCDLQDSLGHKTFRGILILEEEEAGSNLDILNKMEKRGLISSFNEWKSLRNIRNQFSHDYPESDEEKADILNIAYSNTTKLVSIVDNVIDYAHNKIKLSMDKFPYLIRK